MIIELGLALLSFHPVPLDKKSGLDEKSGAQVALGGLDPVGLCQGKELRGLEEFSASDGVYLYRFASEENQKLFAKSPDLYGIQWGGACARMGPLSGSGNPDRYVVHKERIYIFASEPCRDTFLKAPEKFLDQDDPLPATTPESVAKGLEMLGLALRAHGGAEKIDALQTLEMQHEWKESSGGKEWSRREGFFLSFPDHIRSESHWGGEYRFADVISPKEAFRVSNRKTEPMHTAAQCALRRSFFALPIWALKARNEKGFVVTIAQFQNPQLQEGEIRLPQVQVAFDGFLATLILDPPTGRIVRVAYRGRGPKMNWGKIIEQHSDFREIGGVLFAHRIETRFNDAPLESGPKDWTIRVNPALDPKDFSKPD